MTRYINKVVERRLFAESMGYCMNPDCKEKLFLNNNDIGEKAHIDPYYSCQDNSFENLVILCPNCHKRFDKCAMFTKDVVLEWKQRRKSELEKIFCKEFSSFEELKKIVQPLLVENKTIYEQYYLTGQKELWDKMESEILVNNKKIYLYLSKNLNLFQHHSDPKCSNATIANNYLLHIKEFERTRGDCDKIRHVLFPPEINSMFGVSPVNEHMLPSVESLEELIKKLTKEGKSVELSLGTDSPSISITDKSRTQVVFLTDTPQLRQLYSDYNCFRKASFRLDSLIFMLKYLTNRKIKYSFYTNDNLREININGIRVQFVYIYCITKAELMNIMPVQNTVIVNLHTWNGSSNITDEAYKQADKLGIILQSADDFYRNVFSIVKKDY